MGELFTLSALLFAFSTKMSSSALYGGSKVFLSDKKRKKTDAVFFQKLDELLKEKEEKDDPYFGAFIYNKESIFGEIIDDANILSITDPETLVSEMIKATYRFCDEIKEDKKFSDELKSVFERAVNETLKEIRIAAREDDSYHKIITLGLLETLIRRTDPYRAYGVFSKEDEPDFVSALNFNPDLLEGYEERGETKDYNPSGKKTLILGIPGMGKTTTMAKLIERCEYDTGVLIGRDFHDESDVTSLIHEIKELVTGSDGKVLVIWDDLQFLSKQEQFINLVSKFSSTFENHLTVISAARVPEFSELKTKNHSFWNDFEEKELTKFPRETAMNIAAFAAKQFDVEVTEEAINKLVEKSQEGTPLYIVSAFLLSSGGELTKENIEYFPKDILGLWKRYYTDLSTNEQTIINTLRLFRISHLRPVEEVIENVSKDVFERNEPFDPLISRLNKKHWIRRKDDLILIHDIPLESTGITLDTLKDKFLKRLSTSILKSDLGRDLDTLMNNNYANLLKDLKKFDDAETHYQRALKINPKYAEAHNNYANLLKDLKKFDDAETHYEKALKINPKYAEVHNNYALLLQGLKRVEEAKTHCKEALKINPENEGAHNNYANLLVGLKRFDEAETHYEKALKINQEHVEAHNNYANLLGELERFDEAEAHFQKALEISPENAGALTNLGLLYLTGEKLFDPEKATDCLIKAFLIKERYSEEGREILFGNIARLEEILSMNVYSSESTDSIRALASILLGRTYLVTGRLDQAYIGFNRFKKFQKHLPDRREEAEKGQESIITLTKKAMADKNAPPPDKSYAFMVAGVIQMTDGNSQEAMKLYQKSLKLAKQENLEVHIGIADMILTHVSNSKYKSGYRSFSLELCSEIDKLSISDDIKNRFREYKKTFEGN